MMRKSSSLILEKLAGESLKILFPLQEVQQSGFRWFSSVSGQIMAQFHTVDQTGPSLFITYNTL